MLEAFWHMLQQEGTTKAEWVVFRNCCVGRLFPLVAPTPENLALLEFLAPAEPATPAPPEVAAKDRHKEMQRLLQLSKDSASKEIKLQAQISHWSDLIINARQELAETIAKTHEINVQYTAAQKLWEATRPTVTLVVEPAVQQQQQLPPSAPVAQAAAAPQIEIIEVAGDEEMEELGDDEAEELAKAAFDQYQQQLQEGNAAGASKALLQRLGKAKGKATKKASLKPAGKARSDAEVAAAATKASTLALLVKGSQDAKLHAATTAAAESGGGGASSGSGGDASQAPASG